MCVPVWGNTHAFLFQLFYAKFTEYLEDFHIWLSLYSQPPSSSYLHTQRLAVALCLLCVYSCLTALVTVGVHEQVRGSRFSHGNLQLSGRQFVLLLTRKTQSSLRQAYARGNNLEIC